MIAIKDQTGQEITLNHKAKKIVSLVPSLTETLVDIGLEGRIIGVTKFCVHPASVVSKFKKIGGTKNPRISDIISLKPDLIIANKEENRFEDIKELRNHCSVYVSDIRDWTDTISFIKDMSKLSEASLSEIVIEKLHNLHFAKNINKLPTCYLIWKDPYMSVGNDTFIHYMLEKYGFKNVFGNITRYPETTIEGINALNPKIIMLSSEPYPFREKHLQELMGLFPNACVVLVDGEMFSWYGSRILIADNYIKSIYKELSVF